MCSSTMRTPLCRKGRTLRLRLMKCADVRLRNTSDNNSPCILVRAVSLRIRDGRPQRTRCGVFLARPTGHVAVCAASCKGAPCRNPVHCTCDASCFSRLGLLWILSPSSPQSPLLCCPASGNCALAARCVPRRRSTAPARRSRPPLIVAFLFASFREGRAPFAEERAALATSQLIAYRWRRPAESHYAG